jgi:hypothetical protein
VSAVSRARLVCERTLKIQKLDAIEYAKFFTRSQAALIRVYDALGNVIETHQHAGDSKEP